MELTGAEIVVKCLQAEGVEYVFGYPGGAVLSSTTSFSNRTKSSTSWCATSRARACCGRLLALKRQGGRALVTSGPVSPTR